jgi:hypothetical protein
MPTTEAGRGGAIFCVRIGRAPASDAPCFLHTSNERSLNMSASPASCAKPKAWFRKTWLTAAAALVFAIALAVAGFAQTKPADRLPELMEVSGVNKGFDHAAAVLKVYMRKSLADMKESVKDSVSPDYWDKIIAGVDPAIEAAFTAKAVRGEFLRAMAGKLGDDDVDAIIAFDTSPFGARMIAMELASFEKDLAAIEKEPDALPKKAAELMEELKNDPERAEVLTEMERSLRAAEVWTDQTFNLGRALSIGLAAANADMMLSPDDIDAIDQQLAEQRPALAAEYKKNAVGLLAFIYHEASVSDLRDYLVFLKSPVGQKLFGAVLPAVKQVYVKAGNDFGWALMRELGKAQR